MFVLRLFLTCLTAALNLLPDMVLSKHTNTHCTTDSTQSEATTHVLSSNINIFIYSLLTVVLVESFVVLSAVLLVVLACFSQKSVLSKVVSISITSSITTSTVSKTLLRHLSGNSYDSH